MRGIKKTAKTTSRQTPNQIAIRGWKKNQNLLALACVAAALIVGFIVVHYVKVIEDKRRFNWAQQRISYAQSQINKIEGIKASGNIVDSCTNTTEQLTNSSVDCQVDLVLDYNVTGRAQAEYVQAKIISVVTSPEVFGKISLTPTSPPTFNVPSERLDCDWSFDGDPLTVKEGVTTPQSVEISCGAPSEDIFPTP